MARSLSLRVFVFAAALAGSASAADARDLSDLFSSLITNALASQNVNVPVTVTGPGGTVLTGTIFGGTFNPDQGLANLSNSTFSQLQENFPIASTVAAFTYAFDPTLNVFVRSQEGLGPILGERAQTTGKGKVNVAFATSHVTFDVFEGTKLSLLPVSLAGTTPSTVTGGGFAQLGAGGPSVAFDFTNASASVGGVGGQGFVFDSNALPPQVTSFPQGSLPGGLYSLNADLPAVTLNANIDANIYALFLNYGVLDNLDVGVVIPLIQLDLQGRVDVNGLVGPGGPITDYTSSDDDSTFGLGDIVLRAKYHFYQTEQTGLALRVDLWLPTGSASQLRGLGEDAGSVLLIGSTRWRWFSPHASAGFFLRGGTQNSVRYQLGSDVRIHERISLSVDFVASNDLERNGVGDFVAALSSGLKINPWRRLVVGANALWRLNAEGLRDDVIPSVSVEYTFR